MSQHGHVAQLSQEQRAVFNRLSIRPLVDRENNVIYYLGVQYDVTHQVKAKEEIDKLYLSIDGPGGA